MARQLRTFRDGENVQLSLHSVGSRDPWVVEATIIGREGSGTEERIKLHDTMDPRKAVWEIYRFKGHWAWGTTGARVTVYEENPKPRKPRTTRKPAASTTSPTPATAAKPKPPTSNNADKTATAPKRRGRPRKQLANA